MKDKYRFLEVGIMVGNHEFYHAFAVPFSLCMKHYSRLQSGYQVLSVDDFLRSDLPTHIMRFLGVSDKDAITCHYVAPFKHDRACPVPIHHADSRVDSWTTPFIFDIATYFVNNEKAIPLNPGL